MGCAFGVRTGLGIFYRCFFVMSPHRPDEMFDPEAWYRRARPLFLPTDRNEFDLASLEAQLAAAMPYDLGTRFALPHPLRAILERMGAHDWLSQRVGFDFCLYGAATILKGVGEAEDEALARQLGPYIQIGQERDHDAFFLSCDRDAPTFGQVLIGEDSHPWLPGGYFSEGLPFAEWLERTCVHAYDRGWLRIELRPEERASLVAQPLGSWEILVVARDLSAPYDPLYAAWNVRVDRSRSQWFSSIDELPYEDGDALRTLYEDDTTYIGLIDRPTSHGAGLLVVGDHLADQG